MEEQTQQEARLREAEQKRLKQRAMPTRSTCKPRPGSVGVKTSCAPRVAGASCATAARSPSTSTTARTKGL